MRRDEVGADNTEKQGHRAFPSLLPFCHLASTKGCYATAIYTLAPFPSHPPSQAGQHHMQTKWSCCSAPSPFPLIALPAPLFSDQPLLLPFFQLNTKAVFFFVFFLQFRLIAAAAHVFPRQTEEHATRLHARWMRSEMSQVAMSQHNLQLSEVFHRDRKVTEMKESGDSWASCKYTDCNMSEFLEHVCDGFAWQHRHSACIRVRGSKCACNLKSFCAVCRSRVNS